MQPGGEWELKPMQVARFGEKPSTYWTQLDGEGPRYYYDIWGNIDFGYLGMASGFTRDELLEGTGVVQLLTDLGVALSSF